MTVSRSKHDSSPPVAPLQPHVFSLHGREIRDDYAWMKADNWQEVLKDPSKLPSKIKEHLELENAYADRTLKGTGALRKALVKEMRGRMKEDESSVADPDGPFAYYASYREGGQHPLICRMKREGGLEELLLDGDKLGKGSPFFDLGDASHSPDHRLLGWSFDGKGSEYYTIRIRDLETGRELPDELRQTEGEIVWGADSRHFYYVELDDHHRPVRVRRHRLGDSQVDDELIYEEKQTGWFIDLDVTQSNRFAVIGIGDHETTEAWLLDRHDPQAAPRLVQTRVPGLRYEVDHRDDELIVLTNADKAEDFKLVTAPIEDPRRENWRDLVPYRPGTMILHHIVFANHLARLERENGLPRIVIREWTSGAEHSIAFDEEAYALSLDGGFEFETATIRFGYSSMTTPGEIYDYDMTSRERVLRKRQEVPSGHDSSEYVTERIFAQTSDGESVPISVLYRRTTPLDGSAPCLLYGYGSYGHALSAGFRTNPLSLVDRGFIYAIAHVRGGTEKGWRWYQEGKREKKTNTFEDFIACAETLIERSFTAKGRIVAHGGSAGGLLIGAVANLAPDLFAGMIADVPFVDVLNTMLDARLPLTPPEWPEWGNPAQDRTAFETILSYSPYDNVKAQNYPAILALGGLTDPRVTYWEPAKWVAKIRAAMTGGGPVLLQTNMDAGHGGPSGRFDSLEEVALVYAFALKAVGKNGVKPSRG